LYSKHAGFSNFARFNLPEYDRLYEKARAMPDGPARTRELRRMSELVSAYAPWVLLAFRYESVVVQPWVLGFKYNPTYQYPFPYLDIDTARRVAAK
jgi:ABC-type transport system substrate-binding protein